jgi:glyoxylase-like metal-dependent hydrolase (beta-lactamase superfamily II)
VANSYTITVLLDVNEKQDVDDRAEARSYLIADCASREAVIIDSIVENVERDVQILKELGLTLRFAVETHVHADHITGASALKDTTGARIVYGEAARTVVTGVDIFLPDGDPLVFGKTSLRALATPGHTASCVSYVLPGAVFTGDALFIGSTGRTDLQGGSAELLFESIRGKLFMLPDDTVIYPGHDYHGRISSTIGIEKQVNRRVNLSTSRAAFLALMAQNHPPPPAKIDIALAANMQAGRLP